MKTKMALAHNDVTLARSWRRAQYVVGLICATVLFTVAVIDEWGFPALFLLFLTADLFLSQVIDPDLLIRTKSHAKKNPKITPPLFQAANNDCPQSRRRRRTP